MKKRVNIPSELLAMIDFQNTIGGGRVSPELKVINKKTEFELLVKIPSLSADSLQIDVVDNMLNVFYLQPVLNNNTFGNDGVMPYSIANMALPNNVLANEISASFEQNHWVITIPVDPDAKGFKKHIDVKF